MKTPPIVSSQEWEAARQQLLVKEKALTPTYEWWVWHDEPNTTDEDRPGLVQLRAARAYSKGDDVTKRQKKSNKGKTK